MSELIQCEAKDSQSTTPAVGFGRKRSKTQETLLCKMIYG
jgi:hypothetical protein